MNPLKTSEIARRLAEREDVEPPQGLLEKIKAEIPPALPSVLPVTLPKMNTPARSPQRPPRQKVWLMAASVAAALGGGALALHVMQSSPSPELALQERPSEERAQPLQGGSAQDRSAPAAPALPPPALRREDAAGAEEEQSVSKDAKEQETRSSDLDQPAQPAEGGVAGGVAGGVVGGIPGGVYGGTPGPVPPGEGARGRIRFHGGNPRQEEAPLRAGANETLAKEKEEKRAAAPQKTVAAPSTDGTAEPNDQAYGDVFFESAGVNPFIDTEDDRLSTFGLDVDTGSYTVARRYLRDGHLPPREAVRVEEFVNYFSYGDPPPARGDFALRAEGAPSPFAAGPQYRLLRFNLRAREVDAENRKPAVLTFVVDVSGSMNQENRLGLVKQALSLLLGQLHGSDKVGLVIYGDRGQVLLEPSSDREAIQRAIDRLAPGGSTNAEEGLALAYDVAGRAFRPGAINRIILCTDGVANVGNTGPESILARIGREARRGIELTSLGFGMGNYNDALLEQLADKGDGRYAYIDDLDEARRVLVEELTGTLQTIARDAKVQVDFDPAVVSRWRLLGYENRDIADDKFRDDTVDAGEIGAGHNVTALYEVKLKPGVAGGQKIATLHLRFRAADTREVLETTRELRVADLAGSWDMASPSFRLAALVGELAEVLRGSYWAEDVKLDDLAKQARRAAAELVDSPRALDVLDFARLVEDAARLKKK
jgi:Ca-activated chloride channel family protein